MYPRYEAVITLCYGARMRSFLKLDNTVSIAVLATSLFSVLLLAGCRSEKISADDLLADAVEEFRQIDSLRIVTEGVSIEGEEETPGRGTFEIQYGVGFRALSTSEGGYDESIVTDTHYFQRGAPDASWEVHEQVGGVPAISKPQGLDLEKMIEEMFLINVTLAGEETIRGVRVQKIKAETDMAPYVRQIIPEGSPESAERIARYESGYRNIGLWIGVDDHMVHRISVDQFFPGNEREESQHNIYTMDYMDFNNVTVEVPDVP